MPEFQNWQHAALFNRLIANIDTEMADGYYQLEMRLTARQCDQLASIANIFEALARAGNGPPPIQDPGGD